MNPNEERNEEMNRAIYEWYEKNYIDEATKERLQHILQQNDNRRNILVTFAVIGAISCGLLAFVTLVMDERWIEFLRKRLGASEWLIGILFFLLTLLLVWLSKRRIKKQQKVSAIQEAFNIIIVMSAAIALAYIGRAFYVQNGNYALLLLIAIIVYALIAMYLHSALVGIVAILSLIGWWGAQTYFWSGGTPYFIGMNYPFRFGLFAVVLLLIFILAGRVLQFKQYWQPIRVFLWLNLCLTWWALSVFGNSATISEWTEIRQKHFWYWAVAYSVFTISMAAYGLKKKDDLLRDLGLAFLLVNIYTRYFEYFWDKTNKGLFFVILAVSFWWMAKLLERWKRPTETLS